MVDLIFNPSLTSFSRREVNPRAEVLNTAHRQAVQFGVEAADSLAIVDYGGYIEEDLVQRVSNLGTGILSGSAALEAIDQRY